MNPEQRRGLLLLALSAVGAVVVFALVASYVGSVSSQVGPMSTVYVADRAIAPQQAVGADDVVARQVPTRYVTPATILDQGGFLGHRSIDGISKGTWLQEDLVEPASSVADGEREVSVTFDAAQGINGRVRPGDLVDVVGAFAARQESSVGDPSVRRAQIPDNTAGVLVRDARVVSVGAATRAGTPVGTADQGGTDVEATVAVTFSVPLEQAVRLSYGEAFAVSLRIVRSGNNETGDEVERKDLSFDDAQLPDALSPPPPAPAPTPKPTPTEPPPAPEPEPDAGGNP